MADGWRIRRLDGKRSSSFRNPRTRLVRRSIREADWDPRSAVTADDIEAAPDTAAVYCRVNIALLCW
jgi:hypothetical protein